MAKKEYLSSPIQIELTCKNKSDASKLSLSAIMLSDGLIRSIEDIISFVGRLSKKDIVSADQSVVLTLCNKNKKNRPQNYSLSTQSMQIKLDLVTPEVNNIVFTVHTNGNIGLDTIPEVKFHLTDANNYAKQILLTENIDENINCYIVGRIEKYSDKWSFCFEGETMMSGFEFAYESYTDEDFREQYPFDKFIKMVLSSKSQVGSEEKSSLGSDNQAPQTSVVNNKENTKQEDVSNNTTKKQSKINHIKYSHKNDLSDDINKKQLKTTRKHKKY